jgi:hypothetical protein
VGPSGETPEELVKDLEHMLADAKSQPALVLAELQQRFPGRSR